MRFIFAPNGIDILLVFKYYWKKHGTLFTRHSVMALMGNLLKFVGNMRKYLIWNTFCPITFRISIRMRNCLGSTLIKKLVES